MSIPERIEPTKSADYLEIMTRAIFQAGVSWKLVENKWDAFREVFLDFDPRKVAKFEQKDVERLLDDKRILRSQSKIDATIHNAKAILSLEKEFGSFKKYLSSLKTYKDRSDDIRTRFKYMGDISIYYFLFRIGEKVPEFEEWNETVQGDHPRIREMVEHAKPK